MQTRRLLRPKRFFSVRVSQLAVPVRRCSLPLALPRRSNSARNGLYQHKILNLRESKIDCAKRKSVCSFRCPVVCWSAGENASVTAGDFFFFLPLQNAKLKAKAERFQRTSIDLINSSCESDNQVEATFRPADTFKRQGRGRILGVLLPVTMSENLTFVRSLATLTFKKKKKIKIIAQTFGAFYRIWEPRFTGAMHGCRKTSAGCAAC